MSIETCLSSLLKRGKISRTQHDDAKALYNRVLNDDLFRNMDQATKEAYAAYKTAEIMEQAAKDAKVELAKRAVLYNGNLDRITAHPNGPIAGFMGLYDRDIRNAAGERVNVSSLERENYLPQIAQRLHSMDDAYRSTMGGLKQNVGGIRNMVREVFGQKTGDGIAADAAKGWKAATDWATQTAKNLGKAFDTAEDWRLPQFWESNRVNKFGANEFREDLMKHIRTTGLRIFNPETGKIIGGADVGKALDKAIDNIRMDLSSNAGPSTVFKTEQRVFRFADGEKGANAYLELMDKYGPGQGHYYSMMQGHATKMARELSLLHVFGPKFRVAGDQLLKDAVEGEAKASLAPSKKTIAEKIGGGLLRSVGLEGRAAAQRLHQYMTGQLSGVGSDAVASIFEGTRSFLTGTNMGSAIITALPSDTVNWTMAANWNGLNTGRLAASIMDIFTHDTHDKEAFATRLGITAHGVSRAALASKQYGDQLLGTGIFQRMGDSVVRLQGLHAWDVAINRAFTMEFLASIGERAGTEFKDLDPEFSRFLTGYGFTPANWKALSVADYLPVGATKFLMPDSLDPLLRAKLMSAIGDEKQFAYLAGGANRVKAVATGGAKAGTVIGEAARSFFLFKTFPMTMLSTHGVRAAQQAAQGNWGQIAQLGIFMTLAGALALQAKQALQGKDPRSMRDGFFWGEAAAQGGAMGIYGDFLKEGFSRSGTSLTEAALGPLATIPVSAQRLTSSARRVAEDGTNYNFGAALADDIKRFTPGSTIWWSRLIADRYIFDTIRQGLDSDYAQSFQRTQDNAKKVYGQDFWWAPGQSAPSHAPNLGAAFNPMPGG